ncbi:hypothetical protein [Methylocystis heyeri]|uniref:hypothetical protein n=1 Tax=Methylocystis heyeri TaxID=391905 RepID=UPI0011374067|nr:hypothetical protein [Methylocystis heyeri]
MPLAVHHNSEIGKVLMAIIGIVVFVVIALTWIPELIAPQGGTERETNMGQTVRMIR